MTAAACTSCLAGFYQDTVGQANCLLCIPGTYSTLKGQTTCVACPLGYARGGQEKDATKCSQCRKGETTSFAGSSSCEKCDVGRFGAKHGVCFDCPAGRFQDGKGENECKECGFGTYLSETAKASNADCLQCSSNFAPHTKTVMKAVTNAATGCVCAGANPDDTKYPNGFYMVGDDERDRQLLLSDPLRRLLCRECPKGADCAKDGMLLASLSALPGHWRPAVDMIIFPSCSQGYRGAGRHELAKSRCCPVGEEETEAAEETATDTAVDTAAKNEVAPAASVEPAFSICRSKDLKSNGTDSQCLPGYVGSLCLSCGQGYVPMSGACLPCPAGASFAAAMVPIWVANGFFFLLVFLLLRKGNGKQEKISAKKARKWFGQLKIMLSFVQIFCAMPNILLGVPWPHIYLDFSIPLQVFNFDFLFLLAEASCVVSVRFFDRMLIHLMLPVISTITITAAYKAASTCATKGNKAKHEQMNKTISKLYILNILLMFPGLSTKIFTTFKCKELEGINGSLLMEDWSVSCGVGEHIIYEMIATAAVFLYIIGIPLAMFLFLWRNRKHLHDESSPKHEHVKHMLGGLYLQCKSSFFPILFFVIFFC